MAPAKGRYLNREPTEYWVEKKFSQKIKLIHMTTLKPDWYFCVLCHVIYILKMDREQNEQLQLLYSV